ncbi:type II toxin-antitoxin system HicA family toxin [Caulobacter sp. 17J65-9]|uniref:type II toxin-antitoxin system HicA family toxin n=1 Tax=Caulobacter sp. 17J65-9 TaxID=2709382 RepID=UPI0013C7B2B5|nr:type II toxin-antitoxin system HicA family toxin [Caulobacter sp. 17J65-9]NEX93711.1 type II toxin-antitoxin system HicA family toxin [Caulobacter sp. 17J65-9]
MKAADVITSLEGAGWVEVRQAGSHKQFKHPTNPNVVTVPVHGSRDLPIGTLKSIERKSGLTLRP